MLVGNDIAQYQGNIDYNVYKNNTHFVIMKATEGVGFIDKWFGNNRTKAREAGIPLGYYHFCRPDLGNTPEAEAEFFCKVIDGDPIREGEIIALDYECANQKQSDVDWCKKWLDYVSKHFNGMKPLIYLNQSQVKKFDWSIVVNAGYGLWLASYQADGVGETGQWQFMAIQQTSSSQQVPGIVGNVDRDVFFGDLNAFKSYGYRKSAPSPVPPVVEPPVPSQPIPSIDWEAKYNEEVKAYNKVNKEKEELQKKHNNLINAIKKLSEIF